MCLSVADCPVTQELYQMGNEKWVCLPLTLQALHLSYNRISEVADLERLSSEYGVRHPDTCFALYNISFHKPFMVQHYVCTTSS